jgi:meiotically up-regulated gene 157 (Mug157) protein
MDKIMVFVIHDRAIDEEIEDLLSALNLPYYTKWKDVVGVGEKDPHLGDHVWPGLNNVTMVVCEEEKKRKILRSVEALQATFPSVGLRAFVVPLLDAV